MRRIPVLSFAFAASLAAGCLGTYSQPGPDPGPQQPGPQNPNGNNPDPQQPGGGQDAGTTAPTYDLAGPPAPTGTISVTLPSATQKIRLNESKDLQVTLTPGNGFNGMTMFSVEGLPTGVTATFTPPGAMMSAPMNATLTIKVPSDFMPSSNMPVTIKATSGTIVGSAPLALDVPAELLVTIPKGVNIGSSGSPNDQAFGAASLPVLQIAPGTKVTFVNEDMINHEIHSDGTLGIQHEGGPLQANGANTYTQTFNGTGTFDFHCHIHPSMHGQIVVK